MPRIGLLNRRERLRAVDLGNRSVQVSDIAALPVRVGAATRGGRLFHPVGVVAEGTMERVALDSDGLPMRSCDVIGRVSKGNRRLRWRPDIAGIGVAYPPPRIRSCGPWDVLLASTRRGSRLISRPTSGGPTPRSPA